MGHGFISKRRGIGHQKTLSQALLGEYRRVVRQRNLPTDTAQGADNPESLSLVSALAPALTL
jgi:hypothetical protein